MKITSILFGALLGAAAAINPIIVKGTKFFDSVTGTQFYIVGVDYQPSNDPLADITGLNRDIPLLQAANINAIRVYSTDPTVNHDAGMQLLANAGIYVMLDLSSPSNSITSTNPTWDTTLFAGYKSKIDAFHNYQNVFAFLAGNEVINSFADSITAAYIKASVRDVKSYLTSIGRSIPIGYAATDNGPLNSTQEYLDCLSRETSIDFFGVNTYRFCGNNDFTPLAGFVSQFQGYDAPFIFTEYGCNAVSPRTFGDIKYMYGPEMDGFLSGGFVYEWSQEANNYGLVQISSDDKTATPLQDYYNFQTAIKQINPTRATLSSYNGDTNAVNQCPAVNSDWLSSSAALPPTPDANACSCVQNALSCVSNTNDLNTIQQTFGYICSHISCADILSDSTNAVYGKYSGCNSEQKLSYALNSYYAIYGPSQGASACTFNGAGKIVSPTNNCAVTIQTTPATSSAAPANTGNSVATSSASANGNANGSTTSNNNNGQQSTTAVVVETSDTPAPTVARPQNSAAGSLVPAAIAVIVMAALAL